MKIEEYSPRGSADNPSTAGIFSQPSGQLKYIETRSMELLFSFSVFRMKKEISCETSRKRRLLKNFFPISDMNTLIKVLADLHYN